MRTGGHTAAAERAQTPGIYDPVALDRIPTTRDASSQGGDLFEGVPRAVSADGWWREGRSACLRTRGREGGGRRDAYSHSAQRQRATRTHAHAHSGLHQESAQLPLCTVVPDAAHTSHAPPAPVVGCGVGGSGLSRLGEITSRFGPCFGPAECASPSGGPAALTLTHHACVLYHTSRFWSWCREAHIRRRFDSGDPR